VVNERKECAFTTQLLAYVWRRSGSTGSKASSIVTSLHRDIGQRVEIAVTASPLHLFWHPNVCHTVWSYGAVCSSCDDESVANDICSIAVQVMQSREWTAFHPIISECDNVKAKIKLCL
jgi:hypothetical protein